MSSAICMCIVVLCLKRKEQQLCDQSPHIENFNHLFKSKEIYSSMVTFDFSAEFTSF